MSTPTFAEDPERGEWQEGAKACPTNSGLVWISLDRIRPSPENEQLYRPINRNDPDILELARSIKTHGVQEPLVITRDHYILSGHRRHAACRRIGLQKVPCRIEPILRTDPGFMELLREQNRQRTKSFDEIVREQVIDMNAGDAGLAYEALIQHRRETARVKGDFIKIDGVKKRAGISEAKRAMLEAARSIILGQKDYWPLSDRSIHYGMLNLTPLRHSSKPDSRYTNNVESYKDLCDLLTRARLAGEIPWPAIADPTRGVTVWTVHRDVGDFLKKQLDGFLTGYWRDLQQSQPNHIEIVGEKNTIEGSIKDVAMEYCIPYTLGRGYCSIDPRRQLYHRFNKSGKSRLIILFLNDFDPEGEDIPHSFARSMRDDFGINPQALKVCLTHEQVIERDLPQTFDIKKDSSRYRKFAAKYGNRVHELESIPMAEQARLLKEAIDKVLDTDAFNHEIDREAEDALKLENLRKHVGPALSKALAEMGRTANGGRP